jgi:hypothetical protein
MNEPVTEETFMRNIFWILALVVGLMGCTTPAQFTHQGMLPYDNHTGYVVENTDDGFLLTVNYSRYQFWPESSAAAVACRSRLTSIAWELADKTGKKIKPINEQRIRISMGRNEWTGITSCQAQAKVEWE